MKMSKADQKLASDLIHLLGTLKRQIESGEIDIYSKKYTPVRLQLQLSLEAFFNDREEPQ